MAPSGKLMIRTYASGMSIPIKDANVIITDSNGERTLLAFEVTNGDGKTTTLEVPTPAFEESRNDQNEGTPFSSVDVRVEKDGYGIVLIKNVQIFADQFSEQNVELTPLPEFSRYDEYNKVYTVTPQNL